MTQRYEQRLARYSQWANDVLYNVVAGLPEADIAGPRNTTFGSVLRTLGHNYAVGAIFRGHLEQRPHGFIRRNVPDSTTLLALRTMQQQLDAWYVSWVDQTEDCELDRSISFTFTDGGEGAMTRRAILGHVVNHYTFHRGFVVDVLRGLSIAVPATDLTVYLCDPARAEGSSPIDAHRPT